MTWTQRQSAYTVSIRQRSPMIFILTYICSRLPYAFFQSEVSIPVQTGQQPPNARTLNGISPNSAHCRCNRPISLIHHDSSRCHNLERTHHSRYPSLPYPRHTPRTRRGELFWGADSLGRSCANRIVCRAQAIAFGVGFHAQIVHLRLEDCFKCSAVVL